MLIDERTFCVPVILSTPAGARVATGFICSVPFEGSRGDEFKLAHVYLVTAMHCIFDFESSSYRELRLEMSWMGDQPLARPTLPPEGWRHFRVDELPEGEDFVDIAVMPLNVEAYYGLIVGRATRAIGLSEFFPDVPQGYDHHLVGEETATIGFFHFYDGGPDRIEPIPRFGRLLHVPRGPVSSAKGKMWAYLVESLASSGMSGSPVFIAGERAVSGRPALLGIHVGHAQNPERTGHAGVSLVAPAAKLSALLELSRLSEARAVVELRYEDSPWRFRDRRFRVRNAIAFEESQYLDYGDYEEDHPFWYDYLFVRVNEDRQDPEIYSVVDYWNEWEIEGPMGSASSVQEALGSVFSSVRWSNRPKSILGWGAAADGSNLQAELYLDRGQTVQAVVLEVERELRHGELQDLAVVLEATHYVILKADDPNWIPDPRCRLNAGDST